MTKAKTVSKSKQRFQIVYTDGENNEIRILEDTVTRIAYLVYKDGAAMSMTPLLGNSGLPTRVISGQGDPLYTLEVTPEVQPVFISD